MAVLLLPFFAITALHAAGHVEDSVDALLEKLPVDTPAEKEKIVQQMLKLGEAGARELCNRIKDQEEPLNGKVVAALFGLEHAACREGNDPIREMLADVFGEILGSDATIAAKRHLITELRTLGRAESVVPVAAHLGVKELCEPAVQTLVSIGTDEAEAALRKALPNLNAEERVTLIFALGRLRDEEAVQLLLKEAENDDQEIRHSALFALANIGDPAAHSMLRRTVESKDSADCERAGHRFLRFARRLAERGDRKEAIAVCRELLAQTHSDLEDIEPAAFFELARLLGKSEAVPEILGRLDHENARVRAAALRAAQNLPGSDVTTALAESVFELKPTHRAGVVQFLKERGDVAALPPLVKALKSPDKNDRIAAIAAVGVLGKKDVAPQLIAFLDKSQEESESARTALSAMGDKQLNAYLVERLSKVSPGARGDLLTVLASRDPEGHRDLFLASVEDKDKDVRLAALKILSSSSHEDVVIELMKRLAEIEDTEERTHVERSILSVCHRLSDKAKSQVAQELISVHARGELPVRCALIKAVKAMAAGYPEGLAHVKEGLEDDPSVRGVALRGLADWPTQEPMEDLVIIAKETDDLTEHVLALGGCIRMAGEARDLEMCRSAMAAARRPDEKKAVLGAVSGIGGPDALEIAVKALKNDALVAEAAAAAIKIGDAMCAPIETFVAFDQSAYDLPVWLKGWRDTGEKLKTSDGRFRLYARAFPRDKITLGGNAAPGSPSTYIVILKDLEKGVPDVQSAMTKVLQVVENKSLRKDAEELLEKAEEQTGEPGASSRFRVDKVSTDSKCRFVRNRLGKGARVYIDRDCYFEKIPGFLEGASYVMTAHGDCDCKDPEYITLVTFDRSK